MGLNIKNERVCALARDVARRTGQTQTGAIESALEAYLAGLLHDAEAAREEERRRQRAEADARMRRIDEIVREFRASVRPGAPSVEEILDQLYDPETGLPR